MFFNPFGRFIPQPGHATGTQQQSQPTQPAQHHNTPPASSRQIASLPVVTITVDDLQEQANKECLICLDEQTLGGKACKLPCGHIYHKECIVAWLSKHANCPFCRYELETNDEVYEKLRKKNMENRKLRLRRDELDQKSVSQLRELCQSLHIGIHGCVDKRDIVDRLVSSGKITITENVPAREISSAEFEAMSVRELQHLLLSFGLPTQGLLEKSELRTKLLESGRVVIAESTASQPPLSSSSSSKPTQLQDRMSNSKPDVPIEDMSVSQLINYCRDHLLDISKCINRQDLINCIRATSSSTSSSSSSSSFESKSVKELKQLASQLSVDISDCLEKKDIIHRISTARTNRSR